MTRFGRASIFVLILLGGATSADQTPGRAAVPGSIAGRLVDAERGGPVRKAQVRLISAGPRATRTTTTDVDGRFVFSALLPTDYTLSASRAGYLDIVYGARRPGVSSPGTPIGLAPGQRIENLSLAMPRAGVIAGTVLDEFGDPAFNVPVRAMRLAFAGGERIPQAAGMAVTDDLGAYRIAGLAPGEYLVAARVPASRRIRVVSSSPTGRFAIATLMPGDYRLAAVDELEADEQFDRDFLQALEARAVTVTLGEGEKKTQDIPVR